MYDVIVEPKDDRAYTIFAQSIDRSGYARGTLAPQLGMQAEVPPLDPRPLLTMMDRDGSRHGRHAQGATGMSGTSMDHGAPTVIRSVAPHHAPAEFGPNVDSVADATAKPPG